ncbi:MAG: type IX secretion system protein PorQ [Bacteroidales bacterium]|jgi:hypothetical protein|nr:type IX secretion system protein PorQ [Bacteroidales bacterium]
MNMKVLHKHKIVTLGLILISLSLAVSAQKGENTYQFLQLPNSARSTGLGGTNISLDDIDLSLTYHNPALLSDTLDGTITLNYSNYLLDINYGYSAFAKDFGKYGTFGAGIFFVDYGDWEETDIYGTTIGSFSVKEFALNLTWGYQLRDQLRIGANLKPIYSVMESYKSLGLAFDIGAQYTSNSDLFKAGLVIKNMGTQITTYTHNNQEDLPFEVVLGISQKLAHAPFRFSVTYRNLQQFDIGYEVEDDNSLTDETVSPDFGALFARHLVFGLEFLPSDNFYIMAGYNMQRRAEMKMEQNPGLVGFSWGTGIKISKFNISYSSARYHLSGRTNFFSISTNLNRFM